MNPQIAFFISPEKEQAFLEFVQKECGCNVLLAGDDLPVCTTGRDGKVNKVFKFLVVPSEFSELVHYCYQTNYSGESVRCVDTCSEGECLPYIEYMKTENEDESFARCRLFADLSFLLPEHKTKIREMYAKMKKWIQKNATSKDKSDFFMTIYHLI